MVLYAEFTAVSPASRLVLFPYDRSGTSMFQLRPSDQFILTLPNLPNLPSTLHTEVDSNSHLNPSTSPPPESFPSPPSLPPVPLPATPALSQNDFSTQYSHPYLPRHSSRAHSLLQKSTKNTGAIYMNPESCFNTKAEIISTTRLPKNTFIFLKLGDLGVHLHVSI